MITSPGSQRPVETIFLDRDGTINAKPATERYLTSPANLVLLPGAAQAVAVLKRVGLRVVLATNQRWLSEPWGDPARYAAVHARLIRLLAVQGAWLDGAYLCPHALNTCNCRKPQPGMLQRAAKELQFDLAKAIMIGDSEADISAGRAAGTATILLGAGKEGAARADAVAMDLAAAVRLVLR